MESMTLLTTTSGVQLKFASVQMCKALKCVPQVCIMSWQMFGQTWQTRIRAGHIVTFSRSPSLSAVSSYFLCTTWENCNERCFELFTSK